MKIISAFLIVFFVLCAADIPAGLFPKAAAGKCCCSSASVCRCQLKNGFCPMKRAEQSKTSAAPGGCAMHQKTFKSKKVVKSARVIPVNPAFPFLKNSGCGSASDHKASPTHSRDFTILESGNELFEKRPGFFWPETEKGSFQIFTCRLEKPPQFLSLPI